ncbi:sensor histidine kinase [Flindersiella endophytica]
MSYTRDAVMLRRTSWRLGLQVGLCAAVIVVVLSTLALLVMVQGQQRAARTLLEQAAVSTDDVVDPPAGVWLIVQDAHGQEATPGLPSGLPDEAALDRTARTGTAGTNDYFAGGREFRIYTMRKAGRTIQAALDLTASHTERDRLAAALLLSGGLGLLLAALAGVWMGRRAVRPLADALLLQRRFVSDASHELRTPLTLLSTRVQLLHRHLLRQNVPRDLTDEAAGVVADAQHFTAILDDLLLAADTTAHRVEETVNLATLAEEAVATSSGTAGDRSIRLSFHSNGPLPVTGAPTALRRAMTALLDNAVRHAGSMVTVTTSSEGALAVVEVVDDGPGIDPAILPRIFERFATSQPEPADARAERRYGLGLALVSDIAARHGGEVTAANVTGNGARLRLVLPLKPG